MYSIHEMLKAAIGNGTGTGTGTGTGNIILEGDMCVCVKDVYRYD